MSDHISEATIVMGKSTIETKKRKRKRRKKKKKRKNSNSLTSERTRERRPNRLAPKGRRHCHGIKSIESVSLFLPTQSELRSRIDRTRSLLPPIIFKRNLCLKYFGQHEEEQVHLSTFPRKATIHSLFVTNVDKNT